MTVLEPNFKTKLSWKQSNRGVFYSCLHIFLSLFLLHWEYRGSLGTGVKDSQNGSEMIAVVFYSVMVNSGLLLFCMIYGS